MPFAASVVIPTFDRSDRLLACLRSLEAQTAPSGCFEVIVVVDGSTDDTVERLGHYQPSYSLRHIEQENSGLSAARNAGNQIAEAGLIICLDDDMIVTQEFVAEHLRAHQDGEPRLVQGGLRLADEAASSP